MRNSCDTEPISASRRSSLSERILASLSARAMSRRSSVAAASASVSSMRWRMSASAAPETAPRSTATLPKSGVFGDTRRTSQRLPLPSSMVRSPHSSCSMRLTSSRTRSGTVVGRAGLGGAKQHDLALHEIGEMILDGDENVGGARSRGEPPRKGVEIAHLAFALARDRGVALGLGGEMRHKDGDDQNRTRLRISCGSATLKR